MHICKWNVRARRKKKNEQIFHDQRGRMCEGSKGRRIRDCGAEIDSDCNGKRIKHPLSLLPLPPPPVGPGPVPTPPHHHGSSQDSQFSGPPSKSQVHQAMNILEVYKAQPKDSFSNCHARMDSEVVDRGWVICVLDSGSIKQGKA